MYSVARLRFPLLSIWPSNVVFPMVPTGYVAFLPPLLLLAGRCALAQPSSSTPSTPSDNYNPYFGAPSFNPTMAIVIVFLVTAFLFVGFLSIYIRHCAGGSAEVGPAGARSRRLLRQQPEQGLSPEVLESFPTLVYAEVKGLKLDKGALECAVCLTEFEDDDELRLLPPCSHAFHPDCIGVWLASHVTCPVCRTSLAGTAVADAVVDRMPSPVPAADGNPAPVPPGERREQEPRSPDHATVVVEQAPAEENKEELTQVEKQRTTEAVSRSWRWPPKLPRSYSTGHSVFLPGENVERYTLRLPEHVLKEIFAARQLHRSTSCLAYPTAEEGSSRRVSRGAGAGGQPAAGETSIRGVRGVRLGRSDRWPSFFIRTLSAKVPEWATGRPRADTGGDESAKKWESEGTSSGKFGAVRTPFNCLGSAASGGGPKPPVVSPADKDESSAAPLSGRV